MNGSCGGNKQMPDGMGKWNYSITLEEDHSHAINYTSPGKFLKSLRVVLQRNRKRNKFLFNLGACKRTAINTEGIQYNFCSGYTQAR